MWCLVCNAKVGIVAILNALGKKTPRLRLPFQRLAQEEMQAPKTFYTGSALSKKITDEDGNLKTCKEFA